MPCIMMVAVAGWVYTFVKTHPANTLNGLILLHIFYFIAYLNLSGLPWWLRWQRICLQCRRFGFYPWVRKIPWRGNGYPLQCSCLANSVDRGAWWAAVHRVTQSQTRLKRLSMHACVRWRKKWHPTPVFLPGESQGQRSLVGCRLWGRTESDTTEGT